MRRGPRVRELVQRGFISMVFQPIVDLNSGRISGFEALLRGPAGTPLSRPGRVFGDKSPLSRSVLRELDEACFSAALRSGRLLAERGLLFINLRLDTILHLPETWPGFEALLRSSGVPQAALVVEISERGTVSEPEAAFAAIRGLRAKGVKFALDDFGSAYSGLQHLLWFKPDYIKLDRFLVDGLHSCAERRCIVAHSARLAEELGARVVAEGVEEQRDLLALMELGIPYAQGYHLGRPSAASFWCDDLELPQNCSGWFREAEAAAAR